MLNIGDKVRMSATGRKHWKESLDNPHDREGVVEKTQWEEGGLIYTRGLPCRVLWSNGRTNVYKVVDLELVTTSPFVEEDWL